MEGCTKIIKNKPFWTDYLEKWQCNKPIFKDGLCSKHYKKKVIKATPWGRRENYRPITEEEFNRGCSMKIANSVVHRIYRMQNGTLHRYNSKNGKWVPDDEEPLFTNFVIKFK